MIAGWSRIRPDVVAALQDIVVRSCVIEHAGHMAPAESPEDFNTVLREWLSWPSERDAHYQA